MKQDFSLLNLFSRSRYNHLNKEMVEISYSQFKYRCDKTKLQWYLITYPTPIIMQCHIKSPLSLESRQHDNSLAKIKPF